MAPRTTTGYRKNPNARGISDTTLGLGIGSTPTYDAKVRSVPIPRTPPIRTQDQPMSKIANLAKALGTKVQNYQEANQKKWASEAAIKADYIIDKQLAQGKSFQQIEQDRQAGLIPELDTVLQERSFNHAFGAASATNYFTVGKGAQDYQKFMEDYKALPYNERSVTNLEHKLATLQNKFRDTNNQNIDLAMGASTVLSKWAEEMREEFKVVREQLNDADRVQTGSTFLLRTMIDFGSMRKETGETPEEYLSNWHGRVETALDQFGINNGVHKSHFKQIKLNMIESLITTAKVEASKGNKEEAKGRFEVAMHALETASDGPIPALILDNSLYTTLGKTGEVANAVVKDEAVRLFQSANNALSSLIETDNTDFLAEQVSTAILADRQPTWITATEGSEVSLNGISGKREKVMDKAINMTIAEIDNMTDFAGKPIPSLEKKIRKFTSLMRLGKEKGLNFFKSEFNNLEAILQGGNPEAIYKNVWGEDAAYETFQALKAVDPTLLDSYLPPQEPMRRFFETFNSQRILGKVNPKNIQTQLVEIWDKSKRPIKKSPDQKNGIADTVAKLDGDLDTKNSWWDGDFLPHMRSRLSILFDTRANNLYSALEGDQLKERLLADIKPRLHTFKHGGIDHTLMSRSPKNHNLLQNDLTYKYFQFQMDEFATRNNIDTEHLSIDNSSMNEDMFTFIDSRSGLPIALSDYQIRTPYNFKVTTEIVEAHARDTALESNEERQQLRKSAVEETERNQRRIGGVIR